MAKTIPPGEYEFRVDTVAPGSNDNNRWLTLTLQADKPGYWGVNVRLFYSGGTAPLFDSIAFAEALLDRHHLSTEDYLAWLDGVDPDLDLVGRRVVGTVTHREYQGKQYAEVKKARACRDDFEHPDVDAAFGGGA